MHRRIFVSFIITELCLLPLLRTYMAEVVGMTMIIMHLAFEGILKSKLKESIYDYVIEFRRNKTFWTLSFDKNWDTTFLFSFLKYDFISTHFWDTTFLLRSIDILICAKKEKWCKINQNRSISLEDIEFLIILHDFRNLIFFVFFELVKFPTSFIASL